MPPRAEGVVVPADPVEPSQHGGYLAEVLRLVAEPAVLVGRCLVVAGFAHVHAYDAAVAVTIGFAVGARVEFVPRARVSLNTWHAVLIAARSDAFHSRVASRCFTRAVSDRETDR